MNTEADRKKRAAGAGNLHIRRQTAEEAGLSPASLRGLVSIHALYTFPNPQQVLRDMHRWLAPGGQAVLVNAGRVVNVLEWQLALGWQLLRRYGINKTWQLLREGREISRQNAYIRELQKNGTFWTHTHEEFCRAVRTAGFEIIRHEVCFRGVSDLVVVEKRG